MSFIFLSLSVEHLIWYKLPPTKLQLAKSNRWLSSLAQDSEHQLDVVITWVNGSEPSHIQQFIKYTGLDLDEVEIKKRFNEYGMLRFALRSVGKYMPFARRVFLVTNGQVPTWWNKNNPQAQIVTHDQIFVTEVEGKKVPIADALPTFNSNAIEANLHNIPGLSKYFVYLNDDVLFTKPMELKDFIEPKTGKLLMPMKSATSPLNKRENVWFNSIDYTNTMLNTWYHPNNLETPHHLPQHVYHVFNKDLFELATVQWHEWLLNSSRNRYRTITDPVVSFLQANMALEEGLGKPSNAIGGLYLEWSNNHKINQREWEKVKNYRGKSACIQDNFGDAPPSKAVIDDLEKKLCSMYPERSPFEDPAAPNPCANV